MGQQLEPLRPHYALLVQDILLIVIEQQEDDIPTLFARDRLGTLTQCLEILTPMYY